jgi:hypothetical protein
MDEEHDRLKFQSNRNCDVSNLLELQDKPISSHLVRCSHYTVELCRRDVVIGFLHAAVRLFGL